MKILVSPGFGAGWSTWESGELSRFMLTYEPFIQALEAGEPLPEPHFDHRTGEYLNVAPLVQQFLDVCKEKFDRTPYLGGIRDLEVREVDAPFVLDEYDGREGVCFRDGVDWIVP